MHTRPAGRASCFSNTPWDTELVPRASSSPGTKSLGVHWARGTPASKPSLPSQDCLLENEAHLPLEVQE